MRIVKALMIWALILVVSVELTAAAFWFTLSPTRATLEGYGRQMDSAARLTFDPTSGVVFPQTGNEALFFGPEFVDQITAQPIPGTGFALYTNPVETSARRTALAMGDSMTAGVGALDRSRNNWVSIARAKLADFEFINAAYAGGATEGELALYTRIAPLVAHDTVVLNFYTGNDFVAYDLDPRVMLARYLPPGTDIGAWASRVQRAGLYIEGCERMAGKPFTYRVLTNILSGHPTLGVWFPRCAPNMAGNGQRPPPELAEALVQYREIMARIQAERRTPAEDALEQKQDRGLNFEQDEISYSFTALDVDEAHAEAMSAHAAALINAFARHAASLGKRFVLVIHPHKGEIHFNPDTAAHPTYISAGPKVRRPLTLPVHDLERARRLLKARLDSGMAVFDLTDGLRRATAAQPGRLLYWRMDSHYNPQGYLAVGVLVCRALRDVYGDPPPSGADPCDATLDDQARVDRLAAANGNFFKAKIRY